MIDGQTIVLLFAHFALFIVWSGIVYGLAVSTKRFAPKLFNWSRFWLALLAVALVPLLPLDLAGQSAVLPAFLKQAIVSSQTNLMQALPVGAGQSQLADDTPMWFWLVCCVVLIGCCYHLGRLLLSLRKVNKLVSNSPVTDNFDAFSQQQQAFVKDNRIIVHQTEQSVSPFVFGFFKRHLLLPLSVYSLPSNQLALLIEHELTHLKRQDPRMVILLRLINAIFWFNPFIRMFEQRFLTAMELNCDARVILQYQDSKTDYARTLIASLKLNSNPTDMALMPHFSNRNSHKGQMQDRIKATMSAASNDTYGLGYQLMLGLICGVFATFVLAAKPDLSQSGQLSLLDDGLLPVVNGHISSVYGAINRIRGGKAHQGVDIVVPKGDEAMASFSGRVIVAGNRTLHENYGNVVVIEHNDKMLTLYAHLDSVSVRVGQVINAGTKVGIVGSTGRVTGPHLHFEVVVAGQRVNPAQYVDF